MSEFRTSSCGFFEFTLRPPYNLQNLSLPTVKLCVVVYCTTFWPTYIQTSVPDVGECCKAVSECKTKWVRRFLSGESRGNYATLFFNQIAVTKEERERKRKQHKSSFVHEWLSNRQTLTKTISRRFSPIHPSFFQT